jgi:hypothetical protein
MPHRSVVLTYFLLLAACGTPSAPTPVAPDDDKLVVSAALQDFSSWTEATFGELSGVLEVDADSKAEPKLSAQDVKDLAPNIASHLDAELVDAFIRRNRSAIPVTALIAGSAFARIRAPQNSDDPFPNLPKGAKAVGSLTLPGFSADGLRALLQLHHSWSIHGATVTYVLSRDKGGAWHVIARDQAVFL